MRSGEIFLEATQARVVAVAAVCAAKEHRSRNATALRAAAAEIEDISSRCEFGAAAMAYSAFAGILNILASLTEWRASVLNAELEAARHLGAAKANGKLWTQEYGTKKIPANLSSIASSLTDISDISQVETLCTNLLKTPLPIPFFASRYAAIKAQFNQRDHEPVDQKADLAVAFLKFTIDGSPANQLDFVSPQETHDLEIEVRVSRWPDNASALMLYPLSIEPAEIYSLSKFTFDRPTGDPPYIMSAQGRAIIKVPQGIRARPFEFKYAAQFVPSTAEQPIAVVGKRTLVLESFDLHRNPITGYSDMDRKLLDIRDHLRSRGSLGRADLDATLILLTALCGLACRAIQDDLFPGRRSEADFQRVIRADLRRSPSIGAELEEHPAAAGGITDLSFRGIRIELKSEKDRSITVSDCDHFLDQTTTYTVATGKRIGILCVLDCSNKSSPPYPAEEGVALKTRQTNEGEINIAVIVIQGNIPTPSDLSR